jgi:hypothetical protein
MHEQELLFLFFYTAFRDIKPLCVIQRNHLVKFRKPSILCVPQNKKVRVSSLHLVYADKPVLSERALRLP